MIDFLRISAHTFFDISSFKSKLPKNMVVFLVGNPIDRQEMQELRDFFPEHDMHLIFSDFIWKYNNRLTFVHDFLDSNCHPIEILFKNEPSPSLRHGELLTSQETIILDLLADGHTNREIAKLLFLSVRTIESHRHHLQNKLGAHSRSDLVSASAILNLRLESSNATLQDGLGL